MPAQSLRSLVLSACCAFGALATVAPLSANSHPVPVPAATVENINKTIVTNLSRAILGNVKVHDLRRYFAHDLIVHDPAMANGRGGMLAAIDQLRRTLPGNTLTIKHILADRDLVLVHSHISATPDNEFTGINRIDIYRLDRGVVVEHWNAQGPAPTKSASGNSAFSNLYSYNGTAPVLTQERAETNRLLVKTVSEEVFGKRNFGLIERFWGPDYIQHNPYVASGRAAFASVVNYIAPVGVSYRVVHSLGDGDMTAVCAHVVPPGGDPKNEFSGDLVCDLFRVANLQLVEHWDVYQTIPASSTSGNSMVSQLYRGRGNR